MRAFTSGLLSLAALLALASAPARAGEPRTLRVDGVERGYWLHAPASAKPGAPLVIVLHGAGGGGEQAARAYRWDRKAEAEGFVVAAPDASPSFAGRPASFATNPRVWNDGSGRGSPNIRASDDVGLVAALIESLARSHRIDPARVYVTGFSSGAGMAQRVGQELAPRVAAIAPVAGIMVAAPRAPARAMPVFYLSGDRDPLNPVEGGVISLPWGGRYPKEPLAVVVGRWRALNGCPDAAARDDSGGVDTLAWRGCRDGVEVRYSLVRGLGHEWPGGARSGLPESMVGPHSAALDATAEIWRFFARWRLP
ncbi:MAG: dienelactone hydrolase family protein [Rhodospirillales bacterium]|nr:MAG: dienelactone hydrolase family protein [Rhodospirillales bacterium]